MPFTTTPPTLPPDPPVVLTVSELADSLNQIIEGGLSKAPLVIETSQGDRYLAEEVVVDGDNVRLFLGEKVA